MKNTSLNDTIVAVATPPGEGALAIIRLSGPESFPIVDNLFRNKDLSRAESHTLHYGTLYKENGEILDEVVVSLFRNPRSYTGEDVVEVSCHGSSFIIQQIMETCIGAGARMANPGEFTMRAFLHGKMDLSQAEAVADLIASESKGAHDLALKQMRGGFSEEIKKLREELIQFASLIELELDFSEEDVEFANRDDLKSLIRDILKYIRSLKDSFQLGNVIKTGVSTAIIGRPNAGKSTLLNTILREDRAIVSDIAGTTRDTIESYFNIDGIRFRLIDTAGIREAEDTIERIGVERSLKEMESSSLVLYIFDATELDPVQLVEELEKYPLGDKNLLIIANKMDLNPYLKPEEYYSGDLIRKDNFITLSAINEMNIPYLQEKMVEKALLGVPGQDDAIISNSRHYEALLRSENSLQQALDNLSSGITGDFVAMDIRHALQALGEITGEVTTDDLLDKIFRDFCIGK
ncbi:tRNA uridine-5-carboxymethylaminomethyl(34) synthesis GTPase MnmE [Membranicola marinus]|uniref:tRNA modification GTPase MnmE n=1 Tax=Membranihabitans marinus TaxID=1227546 RepID=A0A953LD18_9BACT|nr:tRNA uridine-5-carboxymethylaminomethyl(34) synthesis GTPase MnmE [Membranihabitans marinus]MBY5960101.1 tRNA uridine-5-carboxymethylaminomethyl(34) synthesis GTPase MnmE [Membranihabitans marinus]